MVAARALFPELPPEAAREALERLPGGRAAVNAIGRLIRFARPLPAREALARMALEALARGTDLPPPASPLEAAFREAHRGVWEPALAAVRGLPVDPGRIRALAAAALAWMEDHLFDLELPEQEGSR